MDTTFNITIGIIVVLGIIIHFKFILLLWEGIEHAWEDLKTLSKWTLEKKLSWTFVLVNSILSYFKKGSPITVFVFHLIWILVIYAIMDSYLETFKPIQNNEDSYIRYEKQKEKITFIVVVVIFSIELLTQIFYNHSIVSAISIILQSNNQEDNY